MILFGLLMERQQPGEPRLERVLVRVDHRCRALGRDRRVPGRADGAPGFVSAIVVFELLLFFSFAVNMWLVYHQVGRWRD